jgi:hypothetical protein
MVSADHNRGSEIPVEAPLFITAFSEEGERFEELIERGGAVPKWLRKAIHLRVHAPSGAFADADKRTLKHVGTYENCLRLLDADWIWKPPPPNRKALEIIRNSVEDAVSSIEYWTNDVRTLSVDFAHPIVSVQPDLNDRRSGSGHEARYYAVVRRDERTVVHVPATGYFYLEMLFLENGPLVVPRALLDTDLPGAFWGFTEHRLPVAARFAAKRILEGLPQKLNETSDVWRIAAAHAVLAHREFLPQYGATILSTLKEMRSLDAAILTALTGMALLSEGGGDKEQVKKDLRRAVTLSSRSRAIYGETVRWLDAKLGVIRELVLRDVRDDTLKDELKSISDWLSQSFIGGQAAAYLGEAPREGKGWHQILTQKKTLES